MSEADFKAAVNFVQNSAGVKLSNEVKVTFYALFKQAVDGPCVAKAPSRIKIVEYTKWKAYSSLGKYVDALH